MFYHEFVLAKKGTLGKVWLAAHWEKKLSRSAMLKHNIVESCQSIIQPVTPLALRTSGHLLLGVVRIHDGKAKDLMTDCSNALCQIKRAFTPGMDISTVKTTASHTSITLGDGEDGRDEIPDLFDAADGTTEGHENVGRADEITMPLENDFMDTDYAAPDLGEAFGGDEYAYAPDANNMHENENMHENGNMHANEGDPDEIEMGRNASLNRTGDIQLHDPSGDNMLDATGDVSGDVSMMGLGVTHDDDGYEPPAPIMDDDMAEEHDRRGAFDQDIDPNFGADTPSRTRPFVEDQDRVENITLDTLETSTAVASSVVLGRRRKLLVDASIELSSAAMRSGLSPEGPNDISRQPYTQKRGPLSFGRPVPTKESLQRRLRDDKMEARFSRPLTHGGRWKGKALKSWQRGFANANANNSSNNVLESLPNLPRADNADEIEVGRRETRLSAANASDFQPIDDQVDDMMNAAPADEQQYEPDVVNEIDVTRDEDGGAVNHQNNDATNATNATTSFNATNTSLFNATFATDNGDDQDVSRIRMDSRDVDPRDVEDEQYQTAEEYEAGHMTRRTAKMIEMLREGFEAESELSFNDLTRGKTRRTAAACLFELLVLKTKDFVQLQQDAPFADITVTPAPEIMRGS